MDLVTVVAQAEEAHRSEAPFFIAGGLLVLFAVVMSVVGFMRPDFPRKAPEARGVMAITVVLVAAALFASVYVAG